MPNYKAAFESASLDLSAIMSLLGFNRYPGVDQVLRAITDLVLAQAEAQALRVQVAALRARVVVVPERKGGNAPTPAAEGFNACLEELARLNGKAVSEGLLRDAMRHLGNWLELHECECEGGFHYCGREQVAKTHRELRALLVEGKESESHAD